MAEPKITDCTEVSVAELASVLGISSNRIYQLSKDGIIQQSRRGHFILSSAVQGYNKFLTKAIPDEDDIKIEKTKKVADAHLKAAKARIAKLEADELEGKMHRSEDVEALTEDMIYTIRGALLALPGRLAVDAAAASTAAEASDVIRKEVYLIMKELSEYKYDSSKYAERVRERMEWETEQEDSDE